MTCPLIFGSFEFEFMPIADKGTEALPELEEACGSNVCFDAKSGNRLQKDEHPFLVKICCCKLQKLLCHKGQLPPKII